MTNEEKATELGIKYARQYHHNIYPEFSNDSDFVYSNEEIKMACQEMAEWKEQQMIEKECEWLKDMACYYAHWECNGDTYEQEIVFDTEKLIKDFSKAMKG